MAIAAQIRENRRKGNKLADRAATNTRPRRAIRKGGPAGRIVTSIPAQDPNDSEEIRELGRKLLRPDGFDDEPCMLAALLQDSAEGCRWLRNRRVEIGQRLAAGRSWLSDDQLQLDRLLGKQPIEANIDPALNAIFQAWDRMAPSSGRSIWESCYEQAVRKGRIQQARHRKMTQGLLDLKRMYWNLYRFRLGHLKDQTPYGLLGLSLPAPSFWEILKLTPEELRKLRSAKDDAS